jgi:hypothetical protein
VANVGVADNLIGMAQQTDAERFHLLAVLGV